MSGGKVAASILIVAGLICLLYAFYRTVVLEHSGLALVSVGMLATVIGALLYGRSNAGQ